MEVYLIELAGSGDIEIKVIDKESFDWLQSPFPGTDTQTGLVDDPHVPDQVKKALERACPNESTDVTDVEVTRSSCQNDRALQTYSTLENYEPVYFSTKDVMRDINANKDTVADVWKGYIY